MSSVSPVNTMLSSSSTSDMQPAVCPGVERAVSALDPKAMLSPCSNLTSARAPEGAPIADLQSGSASLMAAVPVTWSAWAWVLTAHTRRSPSSSTMPRSRSTVSSTGSMSTASLVSGQPRRYVYVELSFSKSCRNTRAPAAAPAPLRARVAAPVARPRPSAAREASITSGRSSTETRRGAATRTGHPGRGLRGSRHRRDGD
mmetsp:Transcript_23588/g.74073  ORF Transcript_23588/g.74073 Transcript_23588/m.74073 type:complete len:201 (+) Transcript_23588:1778-2380(+)